MQPEDGVIREGYYVITLGDEAWKIGLGATADLRTAGEVAEIDYRRRSSRGRSPCAIWIAASRRRFHALS